MSKQPIKNGSENKNIVDYTIIPSSLKALSRDKINALLIKYNVFPQMKVTLLNNLNTGENQTVIQDYGRPSHYGLSQLIVTETDLNIFTQKGTDNIWRFENGYFCDCSTRYINNLSQFLLDKASNNRVKLEVLSQIRDTNCLDLDDFNPPENCINLNNGTFDLEKNELLQHSPNYRFLNKIPVDYNITAKCPKIIKFLSETLYPDDIKVIQEWFGYNLYHKYFLKKALMLVGVADTGKSVLLGILQRLVGKKNCSGVTLQDLCDNQFAPAQLYRKLSNICADISNVSLQQTGKFKIATGINDIMFCEYKFQDGFTFNNKAKLSFSCNKVPSTNDNSDAFYERWIIIQCVNIHKENDKDTNMNLLNELTSKEELEGLLNWSIEGLQRLRKNGCFSKHNNYLDVQDLIDRNPIQEFIREKIESDLDGKIYISDVYNSYRNFCKEKGYMRVNDIVFSKLFRKNISFLVIQERTGSKRAWKGIKLKGIEGIKISDDIETKQDIKESKQMDKRILDLMDKGLM